MGDISPPTAADYAMATAQQALAEVRRRKKPAMLKKIEELGTQVARLKSQVEKQDKLLEALRNVVENKYKLIR